MRDKNDVVHVDHPETMSQKSCSVRVPKTNTSLDYLWAVNLLDDDELLPEEYPVPRNATPRVTGILREEFDRFFAD